MNRQIVNAFRCFHYRFGNSRVRVNHSADELFFVVITTRDNEQRIFPDSVNKAMFAVDAS